MMMRLHKFGILTALVLLAVISLSGQQVPFDLVATFNNDSAAVNNGVHLNFAAGSTDDRVTIRVAVTYRGETSASFLNPPQVLGSGAFLVNSSSSYPVTLQPGQTLNLDIVYSPAVSSTTQGQFSLTYRETQSVNGGSIRFVLNGTTSNVSLSYSVPPSNNVIALPHEGTLQFPATPPSTTTTATVLISNTGTSAARLNAVTVEGSAFEPVGLPLLPLDIAAGAVRQIQVLYRPAAGGPDEGRLVLDVSGRQIIANLQGAALAFNYELISEGQATPINPGNVSLPDTSVGDIANFRVRVTNPTAEAAVINSIVITGQGFSLGNLPFLPASVAGGESIIFDMRWIPAQVGENIGRLRIGNSEFTLLGKGLGSSLAYSFVSGGVSNGIQPGATLVFPAAEVGGQSQAELRVRNTGSDTAIINTFGVSTGQVFSIRNAPSFPVTLAPQETLSLIVVFTPNSTEPAAGQLILDAASFALRGVGQQPTSTLEFDFTGASGSLQPLTQPTVGLRLRKPTLIPLIGQLQLTVDPGVYVDDPSIQFITGGRTTTFTIPANSTDAVFANGLTQVPFQSGTVASTLFIRPAFRTTANYDLTPQNPSPLTLNVGTSAPSLQAIQSASNGTNLLTVRVIGYATTRSLQSLRFSFTPKPGSELAASEFTVDVSGPATFWFSSPASQNFGGQFMVTVTFNLADQNGKLAAPIQGLQSVSVTATNASGTSGAVTSNVF